MDHIANIDFVPRQGDISLNSHQMTYINEIFGNYKTTPYKLFIKFEKPYHPEYGSWFCVKHGIRNRMVKLNCIYDLKEKCCGDVKPILSFNWCREFYPSKRLHLSTIHWYLCMLQDECALEVNRVRIIKGSWMDEIVKHQVICLHGKYRGVEFMQYESYLL